MSYTISLKKSAEKELDALPLKIHSKIVNKLISLKEEPRPKGSKKLISINGYRIRVGDYRIIYSIKNSARLIEIISIAHRKDVYR